MVPLQDATGQTSQQQIAEGINPPFVGSGTPGMIPWTYEYAWPIDCVKARFVPTSFNNAGSNVPTGNISLPSNPLMSGLNQQPFGRQVPARFLVGTDTIPALIGAPTTWDQIPDTATTMGQGLASQTVILTNQSRADLVYTSLITYVDQWDPLFGQAFVSLLASCFAMPLVTDRKAATSIRNEQIAICKAALDQARVSDGNEGWTSVDHVPDWLRVRSRAGGLDWNGAGVLGYGHDACMFGDGIAY